MQAGGLDSAAVAADELASVSVSLSDEVSLSELPLSDSAGNAT